MAEERATVSIEPLGTAMRSTYKMAIYETLHELIQNLTLPPGERLVEADLAARFCVSKTPIREALLMLEQENLVTIVPHVGATVTTVSIDDYEQLLFLQDALEQPALPLIVERITARELASVDALIEQIARFHKSRDQAAYHQLVRRMHTELFSAVRYSRLVDHLVMVMEALRRYHPIFVWPFEESSALELEIIAGRVAHIHTGDPSAAAAAVRLGHTQLLENAQRRVASRDPIVWRYLSEGPEAKNGQANLRLERTRI